MEIGVIERHVRNLLYSRILEEQTSTRMRDKSVPLQFQWLFTRQTWSFPLDQKLYKLTLKCS